MRTPTRKPGKYTFDKIDYNITIQKYNQLKEELETLLKYKQPPAIKEVKKLALMGDFSDNAAYSIAKGRLRGINKRMTDIKKFLSKAEIIDTKNTTGQVQLGSFVTVEFANKKKTYQILGSTETNPDTSIISHNSPLGSVLMGRRVGDIVGLKIGERLVEYEIVEIK